MECQFLAMRLGMAGRRGSYLKANIGRCEESLFLTCRIAFFLRIALAQEMAKSTIVIVIDTLYL